LYLAETVLHRCWLVDLNPQKLVDIYTASLAPLTAVGSEEARLRASLRPPLKLHVQVSRMQLSRDLCVTWSQELDLHQLIWLQVNSGVERHTALAYFGPAPRHQHSGYLIVENNVNREIDLMPLPTARIYLGGHLCRTY